MSWLDYDREPGKWDDVPESYTAQQAGLAAEAAKQPPFTPYPNYAAFIAANVPPSVNVTSAMVGDILVSWHRDPSGTVGPTADGGMWSPADGWVSPGHLGAIMDGVADDTTPFQGALSFASLAGINVRLSGSMAISGPVTLDLSGFTSELDELGPSIIGDGSGTTEIVGLNASARLRVVGDNSIGSGGHGHSTIKGIKFTGLGAGLEVDKLAFMSYEDLFFRSKSDGMIMTDVLSSRFYNCRWRWGSRGLTMNNQVSFSRPNALTFYGCHWGVIAEYGLRNIGGSVVGLYGGSIEGCGKTGTSGLECGLRIENAGRQGEMALDVRGMYIEGNAGQADIVIVQGENRAMYNVSGNTFNRISADSHTSHNIYIVSGVGDAPAQLNVRDNAFGDYNDYTTIPSELYIQISDPEGVIDFAHSGNTYEALDGWPARNGGDVYASVLFNGTLATPSSATGKNVASISKTGAGDYTITFRRPIPQVGRIVQVSVNGEGTGYLFSATESTARIFTRNTAGVNTDFSAVGVNIFR